MIVPAYFEDLLIQSENALPNRAYFIPASNRLDDTAEHRERSDRFQLLNGDWKFRYYPSIHDLTELFYEEGFDPSAYDTIPVPSVWQNHGSTSTPIFITPSRQILPSFPRIIPAALT